ncbi:MAG: hypothetical protein AAB425_03810, partial [Bdellovibrionota bacterium]
DYLKNRGLKHTLRKDAATGTFIYELVGPSLKKGIITALSVARVGDSGGYRLTLNPGPKFDLNAFLAEAVFAAGTGTHAVETEVRIRCSG